MSLLLSKTISLVIIFIVFFTDDLYAQQNNADSNKIITVDTNKIVTSKNEQVYHLRNGQNYVYSKPKPFSFFTKLPHDAAAVATTAFKKESIKPLAYISAATLLLMLADQPIANGVKKFSRNVNVSANEEYKDILNIKIGSADVSIFKAPMNINTAFYQMGQGFPSLLIGAGLFTYGKINHDYRALSTANQLAETFILMGVSTQIIKRITGRQSPSRATDKGGRWRFFPSFHQYQKNTPNYDAFPSGHLATLMSSITILAENYPEKKYIKPVGYSLIGLVGLSMINTDVHWISDYPLALGLGYLCARQVIKHSRKVLPATLKQKNKIKLSYSVTYNYGKIMPAVICKF